MKKHLSTLFVMVLFAFTCPCLFSQIQVGIVENDTFETSHPYSNVGQTGVVYERIFYYPKAGYISLHFSAFDLAPGDFVEITNCEATVSYTYDGTGKVVANGVERVSQFWATHIPGDTAIVKLYRHSFTDLGFGFIIDKWARGYEPETIRSLLRASATPQNPEAICGGDDKEWAKCYQGTTMYARSKAVCRLLINGVSICTGWLLGSAGHVITNNHCIGSQNDASNTDYEFMAEGSSCSTDCSRSLSCPGIVVADSGTLVKTNTVLDYSLVLLPTNVSATYGYLQLRKTLPAIDERIYIPQHAAGKGKQLAVKSDVDSGGFGKVFSTSAPPCAGGPGDISYHSDTEGGSSGSPVIAYSDNLVVALHHCGSCPNRGVPIPAIITDLGSNLPPSAIPSLTPKLTVITPNGEESWRRGTTQTILWTWQNVTDIKIELLKSGILHRTITSSTPASSGSFNWPIPSDQTTGADFRIRITSTALTNVTDTSDNTFTIFNPNDPPTLGLSRSFVSFMYTLGQSSHPPQTVTVSNLGGGVMNWTVAADKPWIIFDPQNGINNGVLTIDFMTDWFTGDLREGTYRGTVTVTAPGAINSPQRTTVGVTFRKGPI